MAPINLDRVQLAYLSACETASAGLELRLADESIHLASAFLLAGFPNVIATLWQIDDAIAVDVADTFYRGLQKPTER